MNNLTLKQLRYFAALADQKHFGRAAEACSISQPALSMQVKDLETSLGSPLFERMGRNLQLTEFGQAVLARAENILRDIDELADLARVSQNRLAGKLRIGVIPTIAPYFLPSIIGHLTHNYSELDIHVRETLTPVLVQELKEGKLDFAVLALPISEPQFSEAALFEEEFVLVRHKADEDKPIPDGETLQKMRLLLLEEGHCFRDQALSFCQLKSGLPRDGLDGSSLSTLVQMVGAGIGVTLIPDMAIDVETRSAEVAVQRFDHNKPTRTIGMIWRRSSPLAEQMHDVAATIQRAAIATLNAPRAVTAAG